MASLLSKFYKSVSRGLPVAVSLFRRSPFKSTTTRPYATRLIDMQTTATQRAVLDAGIARKDLVFVRDLDLKALTGVDAWHRPEPQPVTISMWLRTSVAMAGSTDHLAYSLNYAVITRKVTQMVETSKFKSLEDIAERVAHVVLGDTVGGQWAKVQVKKPRALLRADATEIIIVRQRCDKKALAQGSAVTAPNKLPFDVIQVEGEIDVVKIHKLRLVTIIGVNTIERLHKQNVILDLTLFKPRQDELGGFDKAYDFREVVQIVTDHVEDSSYKTVEAFVTSIAEVICSFGVEKVTVRAEKPSALTFADAAGVEVTRTRKWYLAELENGSLTSSAAASTTNLQGAPLFPDSGNFVEDKVHSAFIAFGSNVGPSLTYIKQSIQELESRGIKVVETSSIYESDPMYVTEQPKFYNGIFKTETKLKPLELLEALKDIEYNSFKRVKELQNGPRNIDLDIVLYDDVVFNQPPKLTIPHVGMLTRSFVLKPLAQLVSSSEVHPLTAETYHSHLEQITDPDPAVQASSALRVVVPLPKGQLVFDPQHHTLSTQIMAIINTTPDSFSDGGVHYDNLEKVLLFARMSVEQGAAILDIGGMSTKPGLREMPSAEEEAKRVVPVIEALRGDAFFDCVAISVDTYRASVAREAVIAGADIVNDISAGQLDEDMFATVAELDVPIILGHTRGTPATMSGLADYKVERSDDDERPSFADNSPEAVIEVVGSELEDCVNAALAAGVRRWQIILDPGIGFAKKLPHNLAVISRLDELRNREALRGYAWTLGPSRKQFIGSITGKVPTDRVLGTAATITAVVQGGADIVRVHDVAEMRDVVKVADSIYRGIY